jgi:hypothetical protein
MAAKYSNMSPWFNTPITQDYLDVMRIRQVAAEKADYLYTIEAQYKHRPDLLAYDLYGDAALWWVFTQRNLNVIQDPIFDFVPGVQIYIPQYSKLKTHLGI